MNKERVYEWRRLESRAVGICPSVGNSLSRRTGLEYLREWTDLARSFDVANGFFEPATSTKDSEQHYSNEE